MIRTLVAHTQEIDDVELAVEEVLTMLDVDANLLAHSVGLVECNPEYIESGVVAALSAALPFDIVGTTTLGLAVNDMSGQLLLSLTVLTSDDAEFSAAVTTSIYEEIEAPLRAACEAARARLTQAPKMALVVAPLLLHQAGDTYVELLDGILGGIPLFGTMIVDDSLNYARSRTIMNGDVATDTLAIVLIAGEVNPSFGVATLSEEKVLRETALVTKSNGNLLIEVNGMPLVNYLETLGLAQDGKVNHGVESIPFIMDYRDGSQPICRALILMTEDGNGVFGGIVPEGTMLSVGIWDKEDVLTTTQAALDEAMNTAKGGLIAFSCIGRNMALGADVMAEMEAIDRLVGGRVPFAFCYSGGEICPILRDGQWVNRFHNDTLVCLTF